MGRATPLTELRNLGPTIIARLNEIGVHSREDLQRVGAVARHALIRKRNPGKTVSVCYYLYSLEGALRGVHWNDLPRQVKEDLLKRSDAHRQT